MWFEAFLTGRSGVISRLYHVDSYSGWSNKVEITADASPWGLGAILKLDGKICEYFGVALTTMDEEILQVAIGSCEAPQVFEALCLLVALRLWHRKWKASRVRLFVRSDNIGALCMVASMRARTPALALIARELALDIGDATYRPDMVAHLPGVSNVAADSLSRRF